MFPEEPILTWHWASNQPNTYSFTSKQILFLCILDALTSLAGVFFFGFDEGGALEKYMLQNNILYTTAEHVYTTWNTLNE